MFPRSRISKKGKKVDRPSPIASCGSALLSCLLVSLVSAFRLTYDMILRSSSLITTIINSCNDNNNTFLLSLPPCLHLAPCASTAHRRSLHLLSAESPSCLKIRTWMRVLTLTSNFSSRMAYSGAQLPLSNPSGTTLH